MVEFLLGLHSVFDHHFLSAGDRKDEGVEQAFRPAAKLQRMGL